MPMCPIYIYMHMWDKRATVTEKEDNNKYIDCRLMINKRACQWPACQHRQRKCQRLGMLHKHPPNAKNRLTMKHQGHIAASPKYECTVM